MVRASELVADTVLEVDGFNPQVSARMLGAFKTWRMLETGRQKLAKEELERIASHKKLSRDLFEIVTKTLE